MTPRGDEREEGRLYTVETGTSAQTVAKMLRVLFPDALTVLDATWGTGKFWLPNSPYHLVGLDRSGHGRPSVLGDFTKLPFADNRFDVVIFDPPYQWDEGKTKRSVVGRRFATYTGEQDAWSTITAGALEAWRVGRLGIIVKIQDYTHASKPVRLSRWVEGALPEEPYATVHQARLNTITDPKWSDQLSPRANSTTFLAFRHGDQRHVRRKPALSLLGGSGDREAAS